MDTRSEAARQGRRDGRRQISRKDDCMKYRHQFSAEAWDAYVTGFYRGAGYAGSNNRSFRRSRATTEEK